jgi:hypothetical protein
LHQGSGLPAPAIEALGELEVGGTIVFPEREILEYALAQVGATPLEIGLQPLGALVALLGHLGQQLQDHGGQDGR